MTRVKFEWTPAPDTISITMDSFSIRLHKTLDTYYTWSKIKDALNDKRALKDVAIHCNIDCLQGFIYLYDHSVYSQLWSKPPTKGCLKAAITEICEC